MRIKKVRLKNGYKRFRDLTIDLGDKPARIVALVGPNGSGKSSVLDGLLYHQLIYERIGDTGQRDYSYHSMDADSTFNYQNIEIDFVDGSYREMRDSRHRVGKGNTIFSFRSSFRYNTNVKISQILAMNAIHANNYGASDASSIDSKMEGNYRRLQAKLNSYMNEKDVKPSEARSIIIGELNNSINKCLDLEITSVGNVEAGQKAYCAAKSLTFDEAAYDGFVTNIVDQNLKDETGRIKNICGIKGSVNSEVFKVSLAGYLAEDMPAFVELQDCIFARA